MVLDSITYSGADSLATERLSKLEVFRAVSMDSILQLDSILVAFKDTFATTDLGRLDTLARKLNLNIPTKTSAKLVSTVNAIIPQDTIAALWKELLSMAYSKWADDDTTTVLSGADSTRLWDIGALCPYQNGPAVYLARTMLFSLDSAYFALRNDCEKPNYVAPSYRIGQFEDEENDEEGISVDDNLRVTVYPNPSNGQLNIHFVGEMEGVYTLKMLTVEGREAYADGLTQTDNTIDVSHLSKGVYFVHIASMGNETLWRDKVILIE